MRPQDPREPKEPTYPDSSFWTTTLQESIGADSADFAIASDITPEDVVVTQDIGLADIVLGRGARAIGVRGRIYNPLTIDSMMFIRHEEKKVRRQGFRMLSVYDTRNGQVNKLRSHADFRPDDYTELAIEGGKHAQFGDYGTQQGDGAATIGAREQRRLTADAAPLFTLQ